MSEFVRVATMEELPPGSAKEVTAEGRIIALYHVEDRVYAIDGICPHAGGPLGEGTLNRDVVTCPWHGWQFNVTNGHHCLNANIKQSTYAVKIEDDAILVELP